jgi:hypothetical protein
VSGNMAQFKPSRAFRRQYNTLFKKDPCAANMLLLMCELSDDDGRLVIAEPVAETLTMLMNRRFRDPTVRQL